MNREEIEKYKIRTHYMIPVEVVDNIFYTFEQENKQLKDNWNKLKQKMIDSFNESQDVQFLDVLQDMQELEDK